MKKPLWSCPSCRRRFAKVNQSHSCKIHSIEEHFANKPASVRKLFDELIRALRKTGPLRVNAVQTSINLVSTYHFGGVGVRKEYLRIGFILDHNVSDPRIEKSFRIGPNRVAHHVRLRSPSDLDSKMLGWMAEAQALQSTR